MTVVRGFAIVLCSTVAFGCGGAVIGRMLATLTPAYYETVVVQGESPQPLEEVGLGLGLSQGLIAGVVVGCVVVLAVALANRGHAGAGGDTGGANAT